MKKTLLMKTAVVALLMMHGPAATAQPTGDEREALNWMYRYLSLPDKADYDTAYYLKNVRLSLEARQAMPWGKTIPDDIFRHFVLPVRVNNENLDNSREVFYHQIKGRVEHLPMQQAILEVNHWCHERVTYRPSDARTSSPLATVRTAYGRCGEESTLLVAALRAVGIPARQVYTPRWAHTDDNHAWVEAWADGRWWFLGACEPEPVLNLGWFNESASRGMLMHTKVFGDYRGPEEVISRTPAYTEINVVGNYAPAQQKTVRVTDGQGRPVAGAAVDFKIYNYAEFYTVARKTTDANGTVTLTAGLGDLLAWVWKDGRYAVTKVDFRNDAPATVVLDGDKLPADNLDLDIVPPVSAARMPEVTPAQRAENDRRLAQEDSIRHAYEATLPDESRGNHAVIQEFLATARNRVMAERLLKVVSAKDLRDITLDVLRDNETAVTDTTDLYLRYVLSPRVENEWLVPYKQVLRRELKDITTPRQLADWCSRNISIDDAANPQQLRMTPLGVYRERRADRLSYKIFFVSAARSKGFAARINEVDGRLQYHEKGGWTDVQLAQETAHKTVAQQPTGTLQLTWQAIPHLDNPRYYTHFTLSKLQYGVPRLLTYPEEATYGSDFAQGVGLEPGRYQLTTGTRMANGSVLAHITTFTIEAGKTTTVALAMRESNDQVQVIGSLNAENTYADEATATTRSLLAAAGRGYYIVGIVAPNHEPTNHALRDIGQYKTQFEQWGRKVILLFRNGDEQRRFNRGEFANLPSTVVWGTDTDGKIQDELRQQLHLDASTSLPIFVIADSFNRVVRVWQGYTIGIGEQILKIIGKL